MHDNAVYSMHLQLRSVKAHSVYAMNLAMVNYMNKRKSHPYATELDHIKNFLTQFWMWSLSNYTDTLMTLQKPVILYTKWLSNGTYLVSQANPFLSIVQYRKRERVWYNCYNGFVQNLTFKNVQSDCRMCIKFV